MLFLNYSPKLNETDNEIYRYIIKNTEMVSYMTIRELSEKTYISTASILRFCKKFDCDGFSDFKVKLRMYVEKKQAYEATEEVDESLIINFIKRTTEEEFQQKLDEASRLLASKELIVLIGMGSSKITAEYGARYFSSIFNMAIEIQNPLLHPISHISHQLADKLCIIALSVSGENEVVMAYLDHFVKSNTSIISITNSSKCSIAQMSDINIPYYIATEKINTADITSQVPAIFIIEKLSKRVNQFRGGEYKR